MPKDKLNDYSATNASNTDVGGVNVDEGMLPSAVNNALRELMTHLKEFADGTNGIDVLSLADDDASASIKIQAPSAVTTTTTLTLPDGAGSNGQALVTNGSGTLSWTTISGGISDVVDDTTPQLGGNLDAQGNNITSLNDLFLSASGYTDYKLTNYNGGFYLNNGSDRFIVDSSGNIYAKAEGGSANIDVRQGSAKAWLVYYNTGTASILDSYNISSVTDYTTGQFNPSYSNNFTSANYAFGGAADNGSAGAINPALAQTQFSSAPAMSSSSTSLSNEDVDGGYTDYDRNTVAYHGDLS